MPSAIVLCAGFGTRLRPLTEELPKPLVPVGDRSILEHAISHLARAGFTELVINVHHLPGAFERVLAHLAVPIHVVVETEIKGTAGGVAGAREHLHGEAALVWNGDILVEPPLDQLVAGCAPNSFCFGVAPRARGEGTVGLNEAGQVVRVRGERFGVEATGGDYVGAYAIGAEARAALPDRGCLFGDVALPLLREGGIITSATVTGPWTDAGDAHSLLAANWAWLRARGLSWFVAGGVELPSTVELKQCVIGAGARIIGHGSLERCVVCPHATVRAPLRDAIVAPSGRVISTHA